MEREVKYRATVEKGGDTEAFDEIRQDVDQAGQSMQRAGGRADEFAALLASAAAAGKEGWEDMRLVVAEIDQELSDLLSSPEAALDLGLDQARQDLEAFRQAVKSQKGDLPAFASDARKAIDQVREASRLLKAEGNGLTDEQEKELQQLEAAYRDVIRVQNQYKAQATEIRREMDRTARSTRELRTGVGGIGGAFSSMIGGANRAASAIGLVTGAFQSGWQTGRGFMDFLGKVDRELGTKFVPTINKSVRELFRMQERMDAIVGVAPSLQEEADELRNVLHQLHALGVEPVSEKLDELRKQLERVRRAKAADAAETERATAKYQEWLEGLKLSEDVLRQQAAELTANLQRFFEEAGDDVDWLAVNERLQGPLLDALRNFQVQGLEPPQEMLDAVHQIVDRIEQEFESAAAESETGALSEAAKAQLRGLLEVYDDAPQEVRERMQDIADAHGVMAEGASKHFDSVRQQMLRYQNDILEAAGLLEKSLDGGEQNLAALQAALEEIDPDRLDRQLANLSEAQAEELRAKLRQHIDAVRDMGGDYTTNIEELSTKLALMVAPWDHVKTSARHAQETMDDAAESFDRQGQAAQDAAGDLDELKRAQGESAEEAESGTSRQDQAAESYKRAGQGASEATQGLIEHAQAVEDISEAYGSSSATADAFDASQRKVTEGSAGVAEALGSAKTEIAGLGADWQAAAKEVEAAKTIILTALGELKSEIASLRAEARGLGSDLASALAGGEAGGEPTAPQPSDAPPAGDAGALA